ncbi:MAG: HugZ family protein [Geminicoccaceae bacterium]
MTDKPSAPAQLARQTMLECGHATLASVMHDAAGAPYASLVEVAFDVDGAPILLLSDLADHTTNIKSDGRACLLFDGTIGAEARLAGARLGLMGEIAPDATTRLRERFLRRHSEAFYASFADFNIYRMRPTRGHLVGGFGNIHWLDAADLFPPVDDADAFAAAEPDIIAHMNEDHLDAVQLYALHVRGVTPGSWRMIGIDALGVDLRDGARLARIDFATPLRAVAEVRPALVALVKHARSLQAQA